MDLQKELTHFAEANAFREKGKLGVALIATRKCRSTGLPVAPERFLTQNGTRVSGLSGSAVNKILNEHGVFRSLGTEVGRTSPMSAVHMRTYIFELNRLAGLSAIDLEEVERFWVDRVIDFFSRKPFLYRADHSLTIQASIADLIGQAEERQRESGGTTVVGTVLQHLVGAKLETALRDRATIGHNSANMNDAGHGRGGDFDIGDAAIHVTAAPGDLLIGKCRANLANGLRPIIVTTPRGFAVARGLAEQADLAQRIEIIEVAQFVSTNALELGRFLNSDVSETIRSIIDTYNRIIEDNETDPSLKISRENMS